MSTTHSISLKVKVYPEASKHSKSTMTKYLRNATWLRQKKSSEMLPSSHRNCRPSVLTPYPKTGAICLTKTFLCYMDATVSVPALQPLPTLRSLQDSAADN